MQANKTIFRHLPNFLTSMNVLSGSIGIMLAFEDDKYLILTTLFIGIATIFDFLDGMTARLLKAYSPMGKELDSLADMVSFGLAPAVILYHVMKISLFGFDFDFCFCKVSGVEMFFLFIPSIIAIFAALRLAKFNIDTRQTESFIGLATPANAIFAASLPIIIMYAPESMNFMKELALNKWVIAAICVIFSFLMVSEIPMFSLKVKNLSFAANKVRYFFLITIVILVIFFKIMAVVFVIPAYIIFSVIDAYILKK